MLSRRSFACDTRPHQKVLSNLGLEPSRPSPCAIMSPRRAAQAGRYADKSNDMVKDDH
jgi:hypothetical protein